MEFHATASQNLTIPDRTAPGVAPYQTKLSNTVASQRITVRYQYDTSPYRTKTVQDYSLPYHSKTRPYYTLLIHCLYLTSHYSVIQYQTMQNHCDIVDVNPPNSTIPHVTLPIHYAPCVTIPLLHFAGHNNALPTLYLPPRDFTPLNFT